MEVDRRLATAAQTLGVVFTAAATVGTAVGITEERVLAVIGNNRTFAIVAVVLTGLSIGLAIGSILTPASRGGNAVQVVLLCGATLAFLSALAVLVSAVSGYASGNGRPTVTVFSATPGSPVKVRLTVRASGVAGRNRVVVTAQIFGKDGSPLSRLPVYQAVLRPDDEGNVQQDLEVVWERGDATRLTVVADEEGNREIDPTCDAYVDAQGKAFCASIELPSVKKN